MKNEGIKVLSSAATAASHPMQQQCPGHSPGQAFHRGDPPQQPHYHSITTFESRIPAVGALAWYKWFRAGSTLLSIAEEVQPDRHSCPAVLTVVWIELDSNYTRQTSDNLISCLDIPSESKRVILSNVPKSKIQTLLELKIK